MRETELSSKIITELRHVHSVFVFNIHGGAYQSAGMPDCLLVIRGKHYWIEWKGADTKLRPLQTRTISELQKAGARVFVVRFVSETAWDIGEDRIEFKKWKEGVVKLLNYLVEKGD